MNVWLVLWSTPVLTEASKFWFYAICISIARSVWELVVGFGPKTIDSAQNGHAGTDDKKKTSGNHPKQISTAALLERIVVDSCDLTLPGSFLGWIPQGDFEVGVAMVVSTTLASREIWARAQRA